MTYKNCKKQIQNGNYKYEAMTNMLDVFLLRERITQDEYEELMNLMEKPQIEQGEELCKNNMQLLHWKDCVIPLPTNLLFFDI